MKQLLTIILLLFCTILPSCTAPSIPYEGTKVTVEQGYMNATMTLPNGWSQEIFSDTDEYGNARTGFRFYPDEDPDAAVSVYFCDYRALPSLNFIKSREDLEFARTGTGTLYVEVAAYETYKYTVTWHNYHTYDAYFTLTNAQAERYKQTILDILRYMEFGTVLSGTEVREIIEKEFGEYAEYNTSVFDPCTGTIWFSVKENTWSDTRYFYLYTDGHLEEDLSDHSDSGYMAKPVIYLYPEMKTDVTVTLDLDGELTCTYPAYENGWNVTAAPDGTLTDETGREYYALYWEGVTDTAFDLSAGFCVAGNDSAAFLEEKLAILGLSDREANEFIMYWLPKMQENAYNLVSFQFETYTETAELTVTPTPDTVIRVYMVYKPLDKDIEIPEQILPETPARNGFTVVEWGGTMLN